MAKMNNLYWKALINFYLNRNFPCIFTHKMAINFLVKSVWFALILNILLVEKGHIIPTVYIHIEYVKSNLKMNGPTTVMTYSFMHFCIRSTPLNAI